MTTILWRDGFDHYNNTTDLSTIYPALGLDSPNFVPGRTNGKALNLKGPVLNLGPGLTYNFSPQSDITVAFAIQPIIDASPIGEATYFLNLNSTLSFGINNFTNTASFQVGATVYTGLVPIVPLNNWTQMQIRLVISPTVGSVTLIFNGSNQVFSINNINTVVSGANTVNQISFVTAGGGGANPGGPYYLDDFILATGGFVGDARIQTDFPVSNNSVTFSPSPSGNQNYQNVNSVIMNNGATYNYSDVVGNQDLFSFTPLFLPYGGSILDVSLTCAAAKSDAGTRTFTNTVLSAAASAAGSTQTPSTSYQYFVDAFGVDPNTGVAWTQAGVNAAYFGYKITG